MGQTPDEIRRAIEETREQMGETVLAIKHKANVPARAKDRIAAARAQVGAKLGRGDDAERNNAIYAAAALILGFVILGLVLRARSARTKERRQDSE